MGPTKRVVFTLRLTFEVPVDLDVQDARVALAVDGGGNHAYLVRSITPGEEDKGPWPGVVPLDGRWVTAEEVGREELYAKPTGESKE